MRVRVTRRVSVEGKKTREKTDERRETVSKKTSFYLYSEARFTLAPKRADDDAAPLISPVDGCSRRYIDALAAR